MHPEPPPLSVQPLDDSRRRWLSRLLATSFSKPSLSELELHFKLSELPPNSGRIVPLGGKPILEAAGPKRSPSGIRAAEGSSSP